MVLKQVLRRHVEMFGLSDGCRGCAFTLTQPRHAAHLDEHVVHGEGDAKIERLPLGILVAKEHVVERVHLQ